MNILDIQDAKSARRKLSMLTCYDYASAKILNESPIDMLLVGDSAAMVMHGFEDTVPATVEMLKPHVSAVRKGAPKKFIIADLPFLSYRTDLDRNIENVKTLMQAGAHAIKLEGFVGNEQLIRHLVDSGVPVMGHIGLTPQFVNALGGFRVQGRSQEQQRALLEQARGLEEAGCFAVVLECVPGMLAGEITSTIKIPTIGIGAGAHCDGQVLVWQDLLGLSGFKPKFVRPYLDGAQMFAKAIENFHQDVVSGRFPGPEETYQ